MIGDDKIDKNDELLNDVVLEVAEVIFIVRSVRENHEIITFTYASKHQQRCVIFIVLSLALDFLYVKKKKLSKSSKRIDQNIVYSHNTDTKTHLGRIKKRGKKSA